MAPTPVATKDVVVHDEDMGIDRKVFAGQSVPPDLIDAYNDAVGSKDAVELPADAGVATDENADTSRPDDSASGQRARRATTK